MYSCQYATIWHGLHNPTVLAGPTRCEHSFQVKFYCLYSPGKCYRTNASSPVCQLRVHKSEGKQHSIEVEDNLSTDQYVGPIVNVSQRCSQTNDSGVISTSHIVARNITELVYGHVFVEPENFVFEKIHLKSQVVSLQTAHSWANAGVLLGDACIGSGVAFEAIKLLGWR